MSFIRPLAALLLTLGLGCSPAGDEPAPAPGAGDQEPAQTAARPDDRAAEDTEAPEEDPGTVTADPAAEVEGDCEEELRNGNRLVAELRVTNTGNLGTRVRLAASWPQGNRRGITVYQRFKVDEGESKDVNLSLTLDDDSAAAVQKAFDAGRPCRVRHRVYGAYGSPSG